MHCKFENESIEMIELLNTEIYEGNRWVKSRLDTTKMRKMENIQNKAQRGGKTENAKEEKREKMRRSKLHLIKSRRR